MKVVFERTGGFAGMRLSATVDTEALPVEDATRLEEELAAACFFDLPEEIVPTEGGADRFHYRITVYEHTREHTVEFGDAAAGDALQTLARQLILLARSTK